MTETSAAEPAKTGFGFCLNTSTVRDKDGKSRSITDLIDIASKAGYDAIEPWIQELDAYTNGGGKLEDLAKRIKDAGLVVPDAIGFCEWIVDDPERRKKGLEQAKRDMDLVHQIGGKRLAAQPVGATGGGSRRDDRGAPSSRSGRRGLLFRWARGVGPQAAFDHRPQRGAPADDQRRRIAVDRL